MKPYEMSGEQFVEAVGRGKLHQASGTQFLGEEEAKTPLSLGEINGYSDDDIARFYAEKYNAASSHDHLHDSDWFDAVEAARTALVKDALTEGREVPEKVFKELKI